MVKGKLKIAYVMTPITFGGSERVNLNFLMNADRKRLIIDPILFLRPWENDTVFETELKRLGIEYLSIPVAKSEYFDTFRITRSYCHLKKIIRSNSYDLIHTHGYLADFFGYIVSIRLKIPIIATCHGFFNEGMKLSMYNYLDYFLLRYFDKVVAVSDAIKFDLENKGIDKNRISVIRNTIPINKEEKVLQTIRDTLRGKLNIHPDNILIGYIGRLSKEKGLISLLKAITILDQLSEQFKLIIIGEGPQQEELNAISNNLNLSNKVIFAGFQTNVDDWIAILDIFVLPSLSEGTPMALLEAMAHGVPCIASNVGGIPQIIDSGIDGILVSPGNPAEISDAIYSLSNDRTKMKSISYNAKEKIRDKFNPKEWTRKIENEYLGMVKLK